MEEDIKVLEELKNKKINVCGNLYSVKWFELTEREQQAIENLINRNKELEKYEKYYEAEKVIWSRKDYIPKSKVREKIEELKQERKKQDEEDEIHLFYDQIDITNIIEVLEELLQEGDDK